MKPKLKDLHKAIDEHKAQELDKKFKESPFAKKWKEELEEFDFDEAVEEIQRSINRIENYEKVKKDIESKAWEKLSILDDTTSCWKRSPISQTINLTYLFLAFILGFVVCAILLSFI